MANNEIIAQENQIDFKAKAVEWLQNMGTQLPKQYQTQFLELCQLYQLNPFKREIYAVGYGNKFNIITGYEVYLKRAERTHKLDGWQCVTNDDNTKAKVKIYRKDWKYPFEHEVLMNEVRQNSPIWQKMPVFMMKKVCIEQGMRLCFPDEMGGMPYGEEEVPYDRIIQTEEVEERNVTPQPEYLSEQIRQEENIADARKSNVLKSSDFKPESFDENTEERKKLSDILTKYESALEGVPYNLSCEALAGNDNSKIKEMLGRCITYLSKKGIKVA